jgi:hypothetical protein
MKVNCTVNITENLPNDWDFENDFHTKNNKNEWTSVYTPLDFGKFVLIKEFILTFFEVRTSDF